VVLDKALGYDFVIFQDESLAYVSLDKALGYDFVIFPRRIFGMELHEDLGELPY
jgi:hypothetical protein